MTINIINQSILFNNNKLNDLINIAYEGTNDNLDRLNINTSSFMNLKISPNVKLDIKFDHSLPQLPKLNKSFYNILEKYFKNKDNKIFNKEIEEIWTSLKENDINKAEKIYGIIIEEFNDINKIEPNLRKVVILLKKMFLKWKSDNILGYYKCFNRTDKNIIVIYDNRIKSYSDFVKIFEIVLAHEFFHFFHFLKYIDNNKNTRLYLGCGNKTYDSLCKIVKETCATLFECIFADDFRINNYTKNTIRKLAIYKPYDYPYSGAVKVIRLHGSNFENEFSQILNDSLESIELVLTKIV